MDNKSKLLFLFLLAALVLLTFFKFKHYIQEREYIIYDSIECNPQIESCFVADCNPEIDEDCDLTPYKKAERIASYVKSCEITGKCQESMCDNPEQCLVTHCSLDNLEEGEICLFLPEVPDTDTEMEVTEN